MSQASHEILGTSAGASPKEIKKAYLRLASKTYPRAGETDGEAFKKVNEAYETLKALPPSKIPDAEDGSLNGRAAYAALFKQLDRILEVFNASALTAGEYTAYETLTKRAKKNLRKRHAGIRHIFTRRSLAKTQEMRVADRDFSNVLDKIAHDRQMFQAFQQDVAWQRFYHPDNIAYARISKGLDKIEAKLPSEMACAQEYFDILSGKGTEPPEPSALEYA